jgi:hypothetical protein
MIIKTNNLNTLVNVISYGFTIKNKINNEKKNGSTYSYKIIL